MPLYHFKVIRPDVTYNDSEGALFNNIDAACERRDDCWRPAGQRFGRRLSPGKAAPSRCKTSFSIRSAFCDYSRTTEALAVSNGFNVIASDERSGRRS